MLPVTTPMVAILVLLLAQGLAAADDPNACDAGKLRCIAAKTECLLRAYRTAIRNGASPDARAVARCQARFDDPVRGCLAKVAAMQKVGDPPCSVSGDTATLEARVDACVDGLVGDVIARKRVFVTSTMVPADFGVVGGARAGDAICQQHATAAHLPGTWMAWTSDFTTSPRDRFSRSVGPYELVDGTRIAENWDDLVDGGIAVALNLDEHGQPGPVVPGTGPEIALRTWTGTNNDGSTALASCLEWSDPDNGNVVVGSRLPPDAFGGFHLWSGDGFAGPDVCAGVAPLYCFEQ